jgi:hypothetical protein
MWESGRNGVASKHFDILQRICRTYQLSMLFVVAACLDGYLPIPCGKANAYP